MKTLFFLILALLSVGFADGEQRELKGDSREAVDAVLLMDTSGSMLLTDPLRLRYEAAKLFIQFLKPGDRLAMVEFSNVANVVRPLLGFDKDQLGSLSAQLTALPSEGQYTDILAAIRVGRDTLLRERRDEAHQVLVLLSDGKMDPDPDFGSTTTFTAELYEQLLPELKTNEIKLHTVYFSELADRGLLSRAASSTDGTNWFTPSADKLHESFADLFLTIKKPQMLPLTTKGFNIDSDIQEATFYINRESGVDVRLRAPSGTQVGPDDKLPNVRWFHGQKFDVVTIIDPEVGNWQVMGLSHLDGFATVLTNLKLVTDWPSSIHAAEEQLLQARLYDGDKPVALSDLSGVTTLAFQIMPTDKISQPVLRGFLVDDGTQGDKIAEDGIFSYTIEINEAGEYRARVIANGPTFERHQQASFRVKRPLVSLDIVDMPAEHEAGAAEHKSEHGEAAGHEEHHGPGEEVAKDATHPEDPHAPTKDFIRVEVSEEASALKKINVKLIATDQGRKRFSIPVVQSPSNPWRYEAPTSSLPHDGQYELQATLVAEGKGKKTVRAESRVLTYNRVSKEEAEEAPAVVEIQEHVAEEEKSNFPWLALILVSVVNIGAGVAALQFFKKSQGTIAVALPTFEAIDDVIKAVVLLEERSRSTELEVPAVAETSAEASPVPAPAEGEQENIPSEVAADANGEEAPQAEAAPMEEQAAPEPSENATAAEDEATS